MSRVAVLTATKRYGGLDVVWSGLKNQTYRDFAWVICDELFDRRINTVMDRMVGSDQPFDYIRPPLRPQGYYSNLPAIYNEMIRVALDEGCDIAVSLQDYVWVPPRGIEKLVAEVERSKGGLISGLCSMASAPDESFVYDREGLWSIFRDDYPGYNEEPFEWFDVRGHIYPKNEVQSAEPDHWEMNWAAFPLDVYRKGVRFDESYGAHIGNENQQFAWSAHLKLDRTVWVDSTNHAVSLPHRHYFADEWGEQQAHRAANIEHHESIYGGVLKLKRGALK